MQIKLLATAATKTNKGGQTVIANPQKGPTCWYYAARMIRESYGRTYSNLHDVPTELQGAREIERRISNLRKIETRIDWLVGEEGLRQQMVTQQSPLPDTLLNKLHQATQEMFPTKTEWKQVLGCRDGDFDCGRWIGSTSKCRGYGRCGCVWADGCDPDHRLLLRPLRPLLLIHVRLLAPGDRLRLPPRWWHALRPILPGRELGMDVPADGETRQVGAVDGRSTPPDRQ